MHWDSEDMVKKKYPKWAITVTPVSKVLAMMLFILFPFLGFYLGMLSVKIGSIRELLVFAAQE
jgi:hypothetical protein